MRSSLLFAALTFSSLATRLAMAEPIDPAGARELLKQGYSLKQQKRYGEALERLLESLRLDSQVKTLINIADCEEKLGHLVLAQKHWILARDQAQLQGAEPAKNEAEKRLAALEARMPRLTIKLNEPVGVSAEVRRDGVLLGRVALGAPLPLDTGSHEVRVTAPGRADKTYSVEAVEGAAQVLEVTVGAELDGKPAATPTPAAAPPAPPVAAPATRAATPSAPDSATKSSEPAPSAATTPAFSLTPSTGKPRDSIWSPQRIAAVSAAGLGAVALGAAGYSWWRANAQHNEAQSACSPQCSDGARSMQGDAHDNARLSTIFVIGGGVLLGGAGALWLTAPVGAQHHVALLPIVTDRDAALMARGRF